MDSKKKKKKDKKGLEHQDKDVSYVTGGAEEENKEEVESPDAGGGDIKDKKDKKNG